MSKPLPEVIVPFVNCRHLANVSIVSVQTITTSVQGLATGLAQLQAEILELQKMRLPLQDRFVAVMKVRPCICFLAAD